MKWGYTCTAEKIANILFRWYQVHVQSDPAGRLVITGDPEQPDNPWGITPFKKVITLLCFEHLQKHIWELSLTGSELSVSGG